MKELKKIGLFIDLSDLDELLLHYIQKLDEKFDFKELTLIHFVALEEVSKEIGDMLPYLDKSLNEILEEEAMEKVETVFNERKSSIKVKVYSGGQLDQLVEWVDGQKFDLVLLAKKSIHGGTGIFSSKVVRLTSSHTLFIPETSKASIQKIVLPLDFSDYSEDLASMAKILSRHTGAVILPLHVLKVGMQYFPYIRKPSEFQEALEKKAISNYAKLKKKVGLEEDLELIKGEDVPVSRSIYDYSIRKGADLIVIGNKGKTDDDTLLIGSVAERLIASDKHLPVLIVK
ncbi:Nucleotide-binding universal stress protein, UspA family [Cyclobacterium lianum]|uniref:Nucleotide-binding universal stress protein, UspA family n=1 Tax=Cyclobacterium lianum TaxID=388280 RepID=A0A1M7P1C7_9BACT|nr:universal stress protein [Cyclobacterium lianum]SHN09940.1 Nucleotide-binding universal stress protein, UspA family [Cyclobacterium lianum]